MKIFNVDECHQVAVSDTAYLQLTKSFLSNAELRNFVHKLSIQRNFFNMMNIKHDVLSLFAVRPIIILVNDEMLN